MSEETGTGSKGADGVAAVDRALSVVAAVEAADGPLTLADLSRATGLYKSTILRLLGSIEAAGYVSRLRDGRYELGPAAFRLGLAYERKSPLRRHVVPVLEDLVAQGTESASFHVRHDATTRLCMFRVNSRHSTLDRVEAGNVLPLERGAAGRVILAYSGAAGPRFDDLRATGWALSLGERDAACAAVAAPVFGPQGMLVGALSLSGPRERFTETAIAGMRDALAKSAAGLTRELGGSAPARAVAS